MQYSKPFYARIESLRGLGALAVAGYHMTGWGFHGMNLLPHARLPNVDILQHLINRLGLFLLSGHAALMMFFVISGFVLRISIEHGPQTLVTAAKRFFIARLFRIYPIILLSTALVLLLHGWVVPGTPGYPSHYLTYQTLFANLLLLDVNMNSVLWAMQLEILMAPIILCLYFVEKKWGSNLVFGFAIFAALLSLKRHCVIWLPFAHHMFAFILGLTIPTIGRSIVNMFSPRYLNYLVIVVLLAMFLPKEFFGFYDQTSAIIEAFGAFVLISLITYSNNIKGLAFLDSKFLRLLGLVSGSYYVLHMLFLPFAVSLLEVVIPLSWNLSIPGIVGWIVIITSLIMIIPLMIVSYYFIEAPGIMLGRALIANRRLQTA